MFSDPSLIAKIAANENTKHLLADPTFMTKLQQIQRNPALAQQEVMQDPRFISVIAMLLNIQMPGAGGEPMQTDHPVIPVPSTPTTSNIISPSRPFPPVY
jgi:stress-induced-phosphoprotein 1